MSSSCSSTANNLWQSRRMNNESPLMVRPSSVATSYVKGSSSTDEPPKVAPPRRAIAGKSVAELQQQHQKLMQQQQQQPVPYPRSILRKTGSVRSNSDNSLLSCSTASSTTTTDTASRAPSPLRMQQYEDDEPVNTTSQEFKVAREGWLYRKNSLMASQKKILRRPLSISNVPSLTSNGNLFMQLPNMAMPLNQADCTFTRMTR